jgi:thiaminase/transcriptional activator TenA
LRFSDALRREADPLWQASFEHPFVTGIADGSLPLASFRYYVLQDNYFIWCFSRLKGLAAAKAPDFITAKRYAVQIQATYRRECLVHEEFLRQLGVGETEKRATPPAPTTYAYTSHLLRVGYEGSLGEIIAALLPCHWLYYEIAQRFHQAQPTVSIYRQWIDSYSTDWVAEVVRDNVERLNALAEQAGPEERERMRRHFLTSSRYEWMFWEMSYRQEQWPV